MFERDPKTSNYIFKSHASAAILRAAGVPESFSGASRTAPLILRCLEQASRIWPDAPFEKWIGLLRETKNELQAAIDRGQCDPVMLFRSAEPGSGLRHELQRWNQSALTEHERMILALIGRALVVYQQTNTQLPIEMAAGLHTLHRAHLEKGKRSEDWKRLLSVNLTSLTHVQQALEETAPSARTYPLLVHLLNVLGHGINEPVAAQACDDLSLVGFTGDDGNTDTELETLKQPASENLPADRPGSIAESVDISADTVEAPAEKLTTARISARLAAADYASVSEKLGLHHRDQLMLDDLIAIAQQLVPLLEDEDRTVAGFAALAILSLITGTSDQFTASLPLQPQADGIWVDLDAGAWGWDFAAYRRMGQAVSNACEVEPVLVPMPIPLHEILVSAFQTNRLSTTAGDLIRAIQTTDEVDFEGFRLFLRALGDPVHPPYRSRFARSFQACLLQVTGSDMVAGLLSASFSATAPAALFYFGPTYTTVYKHLALVYERLGFGDHTRPCDDSSRAGCQTIPARQTFLVGWERLISACNEQRLNLLHSKDRQEGLQHANAWMAHLCACFVLQTAHRGSRLEQLTAQALLTDTNLGVVSDKDATTQTDRTHARLVPWTSPVQHLLAAAADCHAIVRQANLNGPVEFDAAKLVFCQFSSVDGTDIRPLPTKVLGAIISRYFPGTPVNVGRSIWVTLMDELGCDRWLTRSLTGHARDVSRVGDAFFDVSMMETARRLCEAMDTVNRHWYVHGPVECTARLFTVRNPNHLLADEKRTSSRPGVPDPRTLLRPLDSGVLAGWKIAQGVRTALIQGRITGPCAVLGLLHLLFIDLIPDPEFGLRALDKGDDSAWWSDDPCLALYWNRPHFVHPTCLPIRASTWLLLQQTQKQAPQRATLIEQVEECLRSTGMGAWFYKSADSWSALCSCARSFRRIEMQPTLLAVSDTATPSPALNPPSLMRLARLSPSVGRTYPTAGRNNRPSSFHKSKGSDLTEVASILHRMSDQNLRLGERRKRAVLALNALRTLSVSWTPAGTWIKEWLIEELSRTRTNEDGCYQISSLSTYCSTLLVDTRWTKWEEPSDWEDDAWVGFIRLIDSACRAAGDSHQEGLHPRAKHAICALVRSLIRRGLWIPLSALKLLNEPTESPHPFDSASSTLLTQQDLNQADRLLEEWLQEEPFTLHLAQTRALLCAKVPMRSGEVSSLRFDCLTQSGALVIRRVGFNTHKTESSMRTVPLAADTQTKIIEARDAIRSFVPTGDLLFRGSGSSTDVARDNRALDHWKEALKAATGDRKARPHSLRATVLQEITWPGWQPIAHQLVNGHLAAKAARAWTDLLQNDWNRLASATSAAGQSGISSALGYYLSAWSMVHSAQTLALLSKESPGPRMLDQLQIKSAAIRQAKSRYVREQADARGRGEFCSWAWLEKRVQRAVDKSPTTEGKRWNASTPLAPAHHATLPSSNQNLSQREQMKYLSARGLGMSMHVAHLKVGVTWQQASDLDAIAPDPEALTNCVRRARAQPGDRGKQGDIELLFSALGDQIVQWLEQMPPPAFAFLIASLFREKPPDGIMFDQQESWLELCSRMPTELLLVVRRGASHIAPRELHASQRAGLRYRLVPDSKLGGRPSIRFTLSQKDNRVMSSRITSVIRVTAIALQCLNTHGSTT